MLFQTWSSKRLDLRLCILVGAHSWPVKTILDSKVLLLFTTTASHPGPASITSRLDILQLPNFDHHINKAVKVRI